MLTLYTCRWGGGVTPRGAPRPRAGVPRCMRYPPAHRIHVHTQRYTTACSAIQLHVALNIHINAPFAGGEEALLLGAHLDRVKEFPAAREMLRRATRLLPSSPRAWAQVSPPRLFPVVGAGLLPPHPFLLAPAATRLLPSSSRPRPARGLVSPPPLAFPEATRLLPSSPRAWAPVERRVY
jgi:hypothetical protein